MSARAHACRCSVASGILARQVYVSPSPATPMLVSCPPCAARYRLTNAQLAGRRRVRPRCPRRCVRLVPDHADARDAGDTVAVDTRITGSYSVVSEASDGLPIFGGISRDLQQSGSIPAVAGEVSRPSPAAAPLLATLRARTSSVVIEPGQQTRVSACFVVPVELAAAELSYDIRLLTALQPTSNGAAWASVIFEQPDAAAEGSQPALR